VHNAPAGVLSLCVEARTDHTAIAAGRDSLLAGLCESYVRLADGASGAIVLVHGEEQLPAIYKDFDERAPGVFLAMRLTLAADTRASDAADEVELGRAGAVALVRRLAAGRACVAFAPPSARAFAA
jgi:hypothetical protein